MSSNNARTAIVTGASKGLGAGIAKALAGAGAAVVVNYRVDAEGAERVVADITAKGGRAIAVQADVAGGDDVRRLFDRAREVYGPVDVLVNNASVVTFAPLSGITEEEFQREMTTNVLGTILTTQAMAAQDDIDAGSIINVSTAGTVSHPPYASLYVASKSAVNAFTVITAKELGPRGIRVNAIMPGPSDTEGTRAIGYVGSEQEAQTIAATPLGRTGTPDDYGPLVTFLASDDARWITGDVILASGGMR
ncbi:3-oxoacyl-[acyl-carrier protein] reductase [Streptomyces aurantiacus]|uniref:SDR family oxidoreductase n=1 Tax=Streptomyces aurantiacus TaxID=47760 RepID=UPI002793AD4F|nr:SDR family oxidoreductase [Streptomyces aurantiacus]MDQ0771852.1 3-oxoacyl-[acyl-carrier protein] reductase [Streptomyces aurantiacus]